MNKAINKCTDNSVSQFLNQSISQSVSQTASQTERQTRNKSLCSFILAVILVLSIANAPVAKADADQQQNVAPSIFIDNHLLMFEQYPFISNGVTFVPGKDFLDMLGYDVVWNEEEQTLTGYKNETTIVFYATENSSTVAENQHITYHPVNPRMINNELFIPLRLIAEVDGRRVSWDSSSRSIFIETYVVPQINVTLMLEDNQWNEDKRVLLERLSKQVEQDHKLKLGFELVPANHYQEKLNLMIAAGQKLDLAYMPDPAIYTPDILPSIAWKLNDYIGGYSKLSQLPEHAITQLQSISNGLYGIPKLASSVDGLFPVINQDWLDKLGFEQPSNMDELYEVMKVFATYDPDGNGKNDTYGLTGSIGHSDLGSLAWVEHVFNEHASRFQQGDNGIVDLALSKETREALLWLQKAYSEKLLDSEFAVNTIEKVQHSFVSGISGIAAMTLSQAADAEHEITRPITPFVSLNREKGAAPVTGQSLAYDGMYFISSFAKKDEVEHALETINMLHELASGAHTDEEARAFAEKIVGSPLVNLSNAAEETKMRYQQIEEARNKVPVKQLLDVNLMAKLDHNLIGDKYAIDKEMLEMKIKVIMGSLTIADWDKYISKLTENPKYVAIMNKFNQ